MYKITLQFIDCYFGMKEKKWINKRFGTKLKNIGVFRFPLQVFSVPRKFTTKEVNNIHTKYTNKDKTEMERQREREKDRMSMDGAI